MKVQFNPINSNQQRQQNSLSFRSMMYNPKSIINKKNPVIQYIDHQFSLATAISRMYWEEIKPELKPYLKSIEINSSKNNSIIRLWDINKRNRKKYVIIMHGQCHNISSLQDLYGSIINKTEFGILAQEFSNLRECDKGYDYLEPKRIFNDTQIGLKYLNDKGIKNEDIYVLGHSFGAYGAAQLAAKRKDIAGVILVAACDSLNPIVEHVRNDNGIIAPKNVKDAIDKYKFFTWQSKHLFQLSKILKKVISPIDIIHCEQDRYVKSFVVNEFKQKCKNLHSLNMLKDGYHKMDNTKIDAIVSLLNGFTYS